ncbi:unnamed protein product, partial [Menidia menidia]
GTGRTGAFFPGGSPPTPPPTPAPCAPHRGFRRDPTMADGTGLQQGSPAVGAAGLVPAGPGPGGTEGSGAAGGAARIAAKKAQLRASPRPKKLEKLGVYSSCKAEGACKCNGWKSQNPPPTPPQTEQQTSTVNLQEPCRSCSHTLGDHVTHLENVSEEEMNRLLGIVLDVEYLYTCVHKEEDADTKQVYFSLFKGVNNFVQYKFSHLPSKERQTIMELAKILPRHETTQIFGRTLLRAVFTVMRKQLLEQARQEKDKLPPEKRTLILTHFPKFLSMLEEEVYSHSSPIWSQDFLVGVSGGQVPVHTVISAPPVSRPLYYSTSPASVDPATGGSPSPARKQTGTLETNPGRTGKPWGGDVTGVSVPRFLSMLEEEVYSHSSPIWSLDFLVGVAGGQVPVHTVISAPPVSRPLYYSTSPASVDPATGGSPNPARKQTGTLEANPGTT